MTARRWRNLSFALAAVCTVLLWRDCHQASDPRPPVECPEPRSPARPPALAASRSAEVAERPAPAAPSGEPTGDDGGGGTLYGIQVPGWVTWLAPHPGEDLRAYRDRMLPLALAAVAPQRARVARGRDAFAALANLDAAQRAELERATRDTAAALQDRVLSAVLGGELSPEAWKPMAGVAVARDLLDLVARGNRRFVDALRDDQRAALAQHPFDFGDYLVWSTHWEDALKLL